MAIEIKSRWESGKVLYTAENATDVRAALQEAVEKGANLTGANLSRANLHGANLYGANLTGANLSRANLHGANLYGANLAGAYLHGADLSRANLHGADLSRANLHGANFSGADLAGAYLSGADLRGAYLHGANLYGANLAGANLAGAYLSGADLAGAYLHGANLYGANLTGANLAGAKGIAPERYNELLMLLDQPGRIRAYKIVNEDGTGIYAKLNGYTPIRYEIGKTYEVADVDTNPAADCGAGIHVATLPWCLTEWQPGRRILVLEFETADIAAIPHSGGKFRCRKVTVVGEKAIDPVALGLVKNEEREAA